MSACSLGVEEQAAPYLVAPLLTEHLDTFASATEGFKRLRELVRNLAVRGRLVPQDANEEPVGTLLSRVAAAKTIARKSRTKYQPAAKAQVMVSLPQGWQWVAVSELATVIRGISYDKSVARESPAPMHVPLLRANNIGRELNYDQPIFIPESLVSAEQYLSRGDLLIAMSSGSANLVGKAAQVNLDSKHTFGAFCGVVRPLTDELFAYLGLFFQTPMYRDEIARQGKGIGINNVQKSALEALQVPLPPWPEQSRIVAKVEELMALIDRLEAKAGASEAARGKLLDALLAALADSPDAAATASAWAQLAPHFDLLLQTPADVDRLQQALLTLAVKGRLVPQDPNDEPAAELLKRIRAEKVRLIAEGKIRRDKPLPPIDEGEMQYPLPQGWVWVRVPAIADTRLGKMLDKAKNRGQLKPYLRNTNVQWFRFDLGDIKELRLEDDELTEFRVLPGDLLICEGGEPGRCAIWRDGEHEVYFQKALHRVRTCCGVMPEFVQLCLRVDCANGWLERFFTGATIKHFPGQALEGYCVPLPPLAEQSRIVAAVASLTALCDRLRKRLAARRDLSAKLATALAESALQ